MQLENEKASSKKHEVQFNNESKKLKDELNAREQSINTLQDQIEKNNKLISNLKSEINESRNKCNALEAQLDENSKLYAQEKETTSSEYSKRESILNSTNKDLENSVSGLKLVIENQERIAKNASNEIKSVHLLIISLCH